MTSFSLDTHRIMQNMMKMFHRAMKIRKYRRLSRNSLMLSPERQIYQLGGNALGTIDVTQALLVYFFIYLLLPPLTNTPVVGALDSSPNPWDSFLLLQTSTNYKTYLFVLHDQCGLSECKGNTHSLKFNTAPAFTSKVLESTDTQTLLTGYSLIYLLS